MLFWPDEVVLSGSGCQETFSLSMPFPRTHVQYFPCLPEAVYMIWIVKICHHALTCATLMVNVLFFFPEKWAKT